MKLMKKVFLMLMLASMSLPIVQMHAMDSSDDSGEEEEGSVSDCSLCGCDEHAEDDSKENAEDRILSWDRAMKCGVTKQLWRMIRLGDGVITSEKRLNAVSGALGAGAYSGLMSFVGGDVRSPLIFVAARPYQNNIMQLLLEHKADMYAEGSEGNALQVAAKNGNVEGVRMLLKAGCDPNRVVVGKGHPLVHAAKSEFCLVESAAEEASRRKNQLDLVSMLLHSGADETVQESAIDEMLHDYSAAMICVKTAFEYAKSEELKAVFYEFARARHSTIQEYVPAEIAREVLLFLFPQYTSLAKGESSKKRCRDEGGQPDAKRLRMDIVGQDCDMDSDSD